MQPLNVLVVDDESSNREIAEVILNSLGHAVTVVEDGEDALRLCVDEGRPFDIILMDILMPKLDGLTATRRLRAHPPTSSIPILCVSAKASGTDSTMGIQAGCDYYLSKPYRRKDLIEAIEKTLAARAKAAWENL